MSNDLSVLQEQVLKLKSKLEDKKISVLNDSLFAEDKAPYYRELAIELSKSNVVPKCFIGKPTDLFVAMSMGYQLGLSIEQSIQDIAIINGRPSLWGDGLLAVVMGHPDFLDIIEEPILSGSIVSAFKCTIKRAGRADKISVFTLDDAKKASLIGKPGPWTQYTSRMLQMRARSFACRDAFPDALRGIKTAEEVQDYVDAEFTTQTTMSQSSPKSRTELLKQQYKQRQGVTIDDQSSQGDTYSVDDICNKQSEEKTEEDYVASQMDNLRRETTTNELSTEDLAPITDSELDYVSGMMKLKQINEDKLKKAFKYLGVDELENMNHNQANRFIQMLERLPDPK